MLLVTCVCNLQFHLQVVRISFGQGSLISFALIELTVGVYLCMSSRLPTLMTRTLIKN